MEARRFVLLVGAVVLLVDDDQSGIAEWGKEGGTRSKDDTDLPVAHGHPGAGSLPDRKAAVEERNLVTQGLSNPVDALRSQADLGHEVEDAAAPLQCGSGRFEEHRGLATASDAAKQERSETLLFDSSGKGRGGRSLSGIQLQGTVAQKWLGALLETALAAYAHQPQERAAIPREQMPHGCAGWSQIVLGDPVCEVHLGCRQEGRLEGSFEHFLGGKGWLRNLAPDDGPRAP